MTHLTASQSFAYLMSHMQYTDKAWAVSLCVHSYMWSCQSYFIPVFRCVAVIITFFAVRGRTVNERGPTGGGIFNAVYTALPHVDDKNTDINTAKYHNV